MKCKQTREAIDTTSRRAQHGVSVTSHLNACPDCRRHADETASLLSLLSAQPRVQSPADFDSGLTRRIAAAQADETVSMLSLLRTQPRVEVPADFDFRLRARIAREQAERFSPAGVFEKFWERLAQTISLGQAATAMAAAALAVTVSAFGSDKNIRTTIAIEINELLVSVVDTREYWKAEGEVGCTDVVRRSRGIGKRGLRRKRAEIVSKGRRPVHGENGRGLCAV